MRDTESHPPSLPKFLKQPLVVCNGVRKKTERKQCIPETLQKADGSRARAARWGRIGGGLLRRLPRATPQTRMAPAHAAYKQKRTVLRSVTARSAPAPLLAFSLCLSFILTLVTLLLCPFYKWEDRETRHKEVKLHPKTPQLEKDGAGIQSLAPSLQYQPWAAMSGLSPLKARGGQERSRGVEGLELISSCESTKITANSWTAIGKRLEPT